MKTVLVTGASGGMGNAVCKKLIKEGFKVYAVDIKSFDIKNAECYTLDIRSEKDILNLKSKIKELDFIVHTAGIYNLDSLIEISEENFKKIFDINLMGVYRVNKIFAPIIKKGGRITIVTSELAPLNPLPFTGIYGITKSALEKYAYSLRLELMLLDINVSIIRPGAVKTDLIKSSTTALRKFTENTKFYKPNAKKFKDIVDRVEENTVEPTKIADLIYKSLTKKHPKFIYNINRNFYLILMSHLPLKLQEIILKYILK